MLKIKSNLGLKLMLGFACMLILVAGGIGFLSVDRSGQALREQINNTLPHMAHEGAKLVRSRIDTQLRAIEELSMRPEFDGNIGNVQLDFLAQSSQRLGYLGMGIVDKNGIAHYPDAPSADLASRDYIQKAFQGQTNMSEVIISRVINKPVIMLAAPVYQNGEVVNVLIARMDGTLLSEIVDDQGYGAQGSALIVNAQGTLIASPDRSHVLEQLNPGEQAKTNPDYTSLGAAVTQMLNQKQGVTSYQYFGLQRIAGFAAIPGTQWVLAAVADSDEVFASQVSLRWLLMGLTLMFIVLGMLATYYFARKITSPLRRVRRTLLEVSNKSDLRLRVPVLSQDEVGQVAETVNDLLQHFQTILGEIQAASISVATASEQMSSSSSQVLRTVDEQEGQTHLVATAMEEMSASIQEVANNTIQAAEMATLAQQETGEGHQAVRGS
ncbi:MAG: methyl-accepting chemotaxis protein, partial [Gammaproteobacteria bacterium]|nr:methyl-accepting chemotaxis protein [Gammaproteobacteria bacterium]